MNPEEYEALARIEREHWFYRGKRKIVRYWIQRICPDSTGKRLADVGCGTGIFAAEMRDSFEVLAIDDHGEALKFAEAKLGAEHCRRGSGTALPLADGELDVLTALDVLEHIPDDRGALREYHRVLKPGGVMILTVPAHLFLWSDWDVVLHHFRRYEKETLLPIVESAGFELIHWNYQNVLPLPLVFLIRKWRLLREERVDGRWEDQLPPCWINSLLEFQFVALACQRWIRFPFGVSMVLVARKTK